MKGAVPLMASARMDWETPEGLLVVVRGFMPIGLDPATSSDNPVNAERWEDKRGLMVPWHECRSLTWVNPPYGAAVVRWAQKAAMEGSLGADIALLVPARTDTKWFQRCIFESAKAICFLEGRLKFKGAKYSAPFPSVIAYWGDSEKRFRRHFKKIGNVVML